jgi:hypothetical protein
MDPSTIMIDVMHPTSIKNLKIGASLTSISKEGNPNEPISMLNTQSLFCSAGFIQARYFLSLHQGFRFLRGAGTLTLFKSCSNVLFVLHSVVRQIHNPLFPPPNPVPRSSISRLLNGFPEPISPFLDGYPSVK